MVNKNIKEGLKKTMASMSLKFKISFNKKKEVKECENKTKYLRPGKLTTFGLKKIFLAVREVTEAKNRNEGLYFPMNSLFNVIYDELYLEYQYEEFLEYIKEEFKDIFLNGELEEL